MRKSTTTVRTRSDGTIVRVHPDGREEPLPVTPILDAKAVEGKAGAVNDLDNPPLTSARLAELRRVPRIKTLRRALGLTQEQFSERYNIPVGTLRDWEQGRTEPDQAARGYLNVIARDPMTAAGLAHDDLATTNMSRTAAFRVDQRVYPKAAAPIAQQNPAPLFSVGDTVQRVNQPEAIGIVRETRWDEQAQGWNYSIQIGSQLKVVPEEGLQPVLQITSPWDALRQGSFSGADHFVFTLTFHRLRRPPTRIAYSFATSRTQFYPHQFKPLLKFLDNPGKRLLIADDVGLGKTIEAGYILRELQARQGVERVLVVVPARLTSKWKRELSSRFEEHFEIVGRSELLALTSRLRQGREPEPFKWIVSYESARADDVRAAIDETLPPIDVLISDEAHRMRNSETRQHRLGVALGKCAEASIFLSATPVQNRLEGPLEPTSPIVIGRVLEVGPSFRARFRRMLCC